MAKDDIVPEDSRYIPFTQQPACCVPTCLQMIMYKNDIQLLPAEEIGYHLGLVVHPDKAKLFYNVRTSTEKPPAGYGTQIYKTEFEPNTAFKKLGIPLSLTVKPISQISTTQELMRLLQGIEASNKDVLLCFNHGKLIDDETKNWGHVCVFDRLVDGKLRIIDPSPDIEKWRLVDAEKMFNAMVEHGEENSAGMWLVEKEVATT